MSYLCTGTLSFFLQNAVQRVQLQSTVEIETLNKDRIVFDQDTKTDLGDGLLCTVCCKVVWKPVYCGRCRSIFCYKCRPQVGFLKKVSTFFGGERPRHGRTNCDQFEEASIPPSITTDLRKIRVRCAYRQNGCRTLSYYYDLERHEKECQFENIPCKVCQLPLSKREPIVMHTTRACFEEMRRRNPAAIQQQFMMLLDATEKIEAENRRLKSVTENLQRQINTFDSTYEKKAVKKDEK